MEQNQQKEIKARDSLLYISMNDEENKKEDQNWDKVFDYEKKRSAKSLISNVSNERTYTNRTRKLSNYKQKISPYCLKQQNNFINITNEAPLTKGKQFHSLLKREFFTFIKIGMQRNQKAKNIKNIDNLNNNLQFFSKNDKQKQAKSKDKKEQQLTIDEIYKLIKQQDFKLLIPSQTEYKPTKYEQQQGFTNRPIHRLEKKKNYQQRPLTQYYQESKSKMVIQIQKLNSVHVSKQSSSLNSQYLTTRQSYKQFKL